MKQGYRSILHHRCFMQNQIANFINRMGDSIDMIAFSWLVYGLTESAGWSAIVLGVNMLPNVLIQPIAGAIVERMPKKRIMVLCDLGRGVLTGAMILLYLTHMLSPWMLLFVTFLNNSLESFRNPASTGFIPLILPKEDYDFGLAFNQSASRVFELIGTGAAGVILTISGVEGAVFIDMLTFFASAFIIAWIPIKEQKIIKNTFSIGQRIKECLHLIKDGAIYLKQSRILMTLCTIACILNMSLVPLNSFQAVYVSGILHAPAYILSLMSIALTIGITVGCFLYPYIHNHVSNHFLLVIGGAVTGIYYIALVLIAPLQSLDRIQIMLTAVNFVLGVCVGFIMVLANVSFMGHVETEYLARASSIYSAIATLGMPIMSFILSAVCEVAGVLEIMLVFGVFTILLFTGMMFLKSLKEL